MKTPNPEETTRPLCFQAFTLIELLWSLPSLRSWRHAFARWLGQEKTQAIACESNVKQVGCLPLYANDNATRLRDPIGIHLVGGLAVRRTREASPP